MVSLITTFSKTGVSDWFWQRVSAVILGVYTFFLIGFFLIHPFTYLNLKNLFSNNLMQYANFFVLIALVVHAWIGIWTVITDYVKPRVIRLPVQCAVIILLLGLFIWGNQIIWGV